MTIIGGLLVAVALWAGYARGYRQGAQNERRAWESTAQADRFTVRSSDLALLHTLYRNPHVGLVVTTAWRNGVVNVPDPRSLPFK